jgi:hypothetical protein
MDLEDLRVAVYRSLATTGLSPALADLTRDLDATSEEVTSGMRDLARARHVVLDSRERLVMAHPFATIPLGFSVMGEQTLWWGGCAWDSFAVPHLLRTEKPVLVATRCPGCGAALAWNVGTDEPPAGDEVAHFLVPARHIWDDVVHTCRHQNLFCSTGCVEGWLSGAGYERGYVMDLATLWRLASHWYAGRLERGYTRRDPTAAADYFRHVGLTGPFWGL